MRRLQAKALVRGIAFSGAAIAAVALFAPPRAHATEYLDNIFISPDSVRCGFFVNTQACYGFVPFEDGARTIVTGDRLSVNVALGDRVHVPGSSTQNFFIVQAVDATAVLSGGGNAGPYQAQSRLLMSGYQGPAAPIATPLRLSHSFGYLAAGGFCCGYGVPNDGFSLTGASATIDVLTDAVRPLVGYTAGFSVRLPVTPEMLADFQGGSPDSPVILPEGLIGKVTGNIAGPYSTESFYGFTWQGGLFQTQAQIFGADPSMSFQFKLFDSSMTLLRNLTLDSDNGFIELMSIGSLGAGNYTIGLMTTAEMDPSFEILFATPVGAAPIPEPVTWAMLVAGFGLVGAAIRRRAAIRTAMA